MTERDHILDEIQNDILLMNSAARRDNNTAIGVDFKQAVFVKLALDAATRTPGLIARVQSAPQEHDLAAELLPDLKNAYTDFLDFLMVYANKTGMDTPEQIAENVRYLRRIDAVSLVLDPEWN